MRLRRIGGLASGEPPLRAEDYRLLRDLVNERLGVYYGPDARFSLERRLRERLAVRGLASFGDYYQLLKFGNAQEEWEEASELLTTHETYFFREDYQLRAFAQELLPALAQHNRARRRLHIWSAGCSTGEEAYTIGILIKESGLFDGWEVRVYGSDVSKKCIAAARRGVYAAASFRTTPEATKARWFRPAEGGFAVNDAVRSLCHFGHMNLLDDERTQLVGRVDVVFCRNVLIYFDAASRRKVIEMFHERLDEGGVLLLGHSESLLNVSTAFELLHLSEDLVYRKPNIAPR